MVAVTVRTEDDPTIMDVGFAEMETVGAPGAVTVTVAVAEKVPAAPVAVAVYVVVDVGDTDCDPPESGSV